MPTRSTLDGLWFKHENHARHQPQMIRLRMKLGMEGLGIWWCLCEYLAESTPHALLTEDIEILAHDLGLEPKKLEGTLRTMVSIGLLQQYSAGYSSDIMTESIRQLDEMRRLKQEAGRKGGKASGKARRERSLNDDSTVVRTDGSEKRREEKKRKEETRQQENRKESTLSVPDSALPSINRQNGHLSSRQGPVATRFDPNEEGPLP